MRLTAAALVAGLLSAPALHAQEQIVNGDFETGDFTGWTSSATGAALGFIINDGTFAFGGGSSGTFAPINGSFDATSEQTGPGVRTLSQAFTVPSAVSQATLSWTDTIRNFAPDFLDPDQEFRVFLTDFAGFQISPILFSTDPGQALVQPTTTRSFDVTSVLQGFTGQMIRVAFQEQDSFGFLHVSIDDVSLVTSSGPIQSAVSSTGTGCLGLTLQHNAGLPIRGTTFEFAIDQVPIGASATGVLLGFSSLNVDLTGVGAPGCVLRNDGLALLGTAVTPPTSIASLPLPNNPALAGVVLETQGFVLAAGINPLGLITSNGLSLTIGDI